VEFGKKKTLEKEKKKRLGTNRTIIKKGRTLLPMSVRLGIRGRHLTLKVSTPAATTKISAPMELFQGAHRLTICTWLSLSAHE
jgi:hypothetical protein